MRLSPSRMLIARRGTSYRRAIAVAASGSVGATIAPSAKQTAHGSPSISACAVAATAAAVATTSRVELSVIVRRSALSSRRFAKNAPEYRSGGRKTTSTSSGWRRTSGTPGTNPSPRPPTTRRIGYGTPIRVARALSTATATRRLTMTASMWSMRSARESCSPGGPPTVNGMPPRPPLPARAGERGAGRIGLGLAALGRPGYLNLGHGADLGTDRSPDALRARSFEVLDAAYAAGVRYLDAARSYGRAEEFLGAWLADRDPGDVVVGSKWGYVYTAGWQVDADPPEVKHHDAATFRRQLEETREHLGERLALYQIHSATPDSGVLEDREVLDALAELRASGVAIGLTTSGLSQAQTLDRALELDLFDCAQATWNLHERAAGPALERAHAGGVGVIVKEALENGRLARRGEDPDLDRAA